MNDPLVVIALLAVAAVFVVLLMGLNAFRRGGEYNRNTANRFMRWRLALQFLAIVLILAFVWFRRQTGG